MNLTWYINRLRNMEPAELAHRLVEKQRKLVSRRKHQGWPRHKSAPLHPVFPSLPTSISAASPAQREAISSAAQAILAGHYSTLGRDWPQRDPTSLFPPELWRLDPITTGLWPDATTYAFDIDFRHDGSRGDIKYVWEINRLQFLPILAAEVLLTDDPSCLLAIEAAITSWHAANPPFGGVAWASGIEVALRAISLIVTLDSLGSRLSSQTRDLVGAILTASAFWLPRFPSRFSSANNHLVAELAGEYLIALALGHDATSPRSQLLTELQKQILPDGSGAEQTPTYAAFTAEMVLLCALAARDAGAPFPATAHDRLAAFAGFIAALGSSAGFGDDDEGRAVTPGDEPNYATSVASAISGFLARPGLPANTNDFRSLFFGTPTGNAPIADGIQTFPDGGLTLWRGVVGKQKIRLTLDHGPLGYLSIAAHGHADALSVTLAIDDQPVLVDPGTFLYGSGGKWRDWFRSTPAHNTLSLNGESQSIMSGAFNWSHKAQTTLLAPLDAQHTGYLTRFGATHRRTVEVEPNAIAVIDRLLGRAQPAELVYQLAPGLDARQDGNRVLVSRAEMPLLAITFPDPNIVIASGGGEPGQGGWVSPRFGIKVAAPRLLWRGPVGEAGVVTLLAPVFNFTD